jgi:hypothetical protein
MTTASRCGERLLAHRDAGHHVGLGPVDKLVRQALQTICQLTLGQLHRARLGRVPGADQVNDLRDDVDKLTMHLPDLTEQIRLVLGDKPQPFQVVTELVQLAQCGG